MDFGADDGYTGLRSRDGFVESLRNQAKYRQKKTLSIGDGETAYNISGVEGFTAQGEKKGLESLEKAQYWSEKVLPIKIEVDVTLASCGDIASCITKYHSTLHVPRLV